MALTPLIFRFGARTYDWLTAHDDWRAHCAGLASHLPGDGGGRVVLDLGCGPGVSTLALARVLPGDAIIGLDLVEPMLRRARRADRERRCNWLCGDAHRLPVRDGAVDAVTGHSFLYLLRDRAAALAEIRRVLRPGGALVLLEPSRQDAPAATRSVLATARVSGPRLAFTMACWRLAARASGAFGHGELAALLTAAGFDGASQKTTLHGLGWIGIARSSA